MVFNRSLVEVCYADNISLRRCRIAWGANRPDFFTHALEAHDVTGLSYPNFTGESAHSKRSAAVAVR